MWWAKIQVMLLIQRRGGAFYEISDSFSRFSDSMRMRKML